MMAEAEFVPLANGTLGLAQMNGAHQHDELLPSSFYAAPKLNTAQHQGSNDSEGRNSEASGSAFQASSHKDDSSEFEAGQSDDSDYSGSR